jgi:hypothetical protein
LLGKLEISKKLPMKKRNSALHVKMFSLLFMLSRTNVCFGGKLTVIPERFKQAHAGGGSNQGKSCIFSGHKLFISLNERKRVSGLGSADICLRTNIFQTVIFCPVLSWTASHGLLSGYVSPGSHSTICKGQESHSWVGCGGTHP